MTSLPVNQLARRPDTTTQPRRLSVSRVPRGSSPWDSCSRRRIARPSPWWLYPCCGRSSRARPHSSSVSPPTARSWRVRCSSSSTPFEDSSPRLLNQALDGWGYAFIVPGRSNRSNWPPGTRDAPAPIPGRCTVAAGLREAHVRLNDTATRQTDSVRTCTP